MRAFVVRVLGAFMAIFGIAVMAGPGTPPGIEGHPLVVPIAGALIVLGAVLILYGDGS
jgi:hypothetical protein